MATYVNDLRLKEIGTGESSGTWGTETNVNLELIGEALSFGTEAITTNADTHTSTVADGSTDPARSMYIKYTGTLDSACTITIAPNTLSRLHFIENGTSGSQNIIISQGSGANVTIPPGDVKVVYLDGAGSGAAVVDAFASLSVVDLKVQDDLTVTDDATIGGTLGVTGAVTANAGISIDNITIDGTEIDLSSGDLTIDVAGDIKLDAAGNDWIFLSGGTAIGRIINSSSDFVIQADVQDQDIIFKGDDGGSGITALTLDMSAAGAATFNDKITAVGTSVFTNLDISGDVDIDGTTNLDVVDIDGAVDMASTLTVGGDVTINSTTLKVSGSFPQLFFEDTAGSDLDAYIVNNANGLFIGKTNSPSSSNDIMSFDLSNQIVGIGGAAAFSTFEVIGDKTEGNNLQLTLKGATNTNKQMIMGFDTTADTAHVTTQIAGSSPTPLIFKTGNVVFNESSSDSDFRVESNGNTHAIFVDAGNDRVGILESSPGGPLEVAADGGASCINMIGRDNSASDEAALQFIDHNGSTANAMIINSGQSIAFFSGGTSTETARFSAERNLHLGTTATLGVSGGGIRQGIGSGESDGDTYFVAQGGGSNATPFVLQVVSQNLYDSGTTAMQVGRHSGNQRSISAGGSINASGADYAEYMKKADACGTIAKGDVCGVDSTGKLTDVFSNAISFVIKSTEPSYVGGDIWGSVELDLTEEQYEAERQKHDRIAFSGQVPVNITGSFNVGDYVYPQANGSGIQCVAKSNPTFEEYQLCVGKIWATESDGRPLVAVKIG